MRIEPIGVFRCDEKYPYDAARQGQVAGGNRGRVELFSCRNFEQALRDLEGFSHLWLIFQFHANENWKPLVHPPRADRKVGVFASRAPYRPNAIGLSCVRLLSVDGLRVEVEAHDLLDGTPILDIKPYLPYADSFPEARCGWLDEIDSRVWNLTFSRLARRQLDWLQAHGVDCLEGFLRRQLSEQPFDARRKRLRLLGKDSWEIAYRTWRVAYRAWEEEERIMVDGVSTGYSKEELTHSDDPHEDKEVHRLFCAALPAGLNGTTLL
jgi:tRNA (adenine37-N6)-methyltransferase